MSHVDFSLNSIARPRSAARRLPRLVGWGLAGVVSAGLWFGAVELLRAAF